MNILTAGPKLLKIVEDLRSASQDPAISKTIADLEDFYNTEIATSSGTPAQTQPPATPVA